MLIAGLDLAAEPKGTALALIDWADSKAELVSLTLGIADEAIIDAVADCEKFGIDCALGWQLQFVEFLALHASIDGQAPEFDGGIEWRRRMAYRETDRHVREVTGRWPLSVSTDRLGMTAMRCAGLLSKLQASGTTIDRSGSGQVVEIYPGATLRLWGFDTAGYRASADRRADLLGDLEARAPWLNLGNNRELMIDSCDAFDAVIAALATRSAQLGQYENPNALQLKQAQVEGWVALPTGSLEDLIAPQSS
jgi:predicted nuclease with RNAse H fold